MRRFLTRHLIRPLYAAAARLPLGRYAAEFAALERWEPERLDAWRLDRLRAVVAHAERAIPFYSERFAAAGVGAADLRSLADLARFPLLEKTDLADLEASAPHPPGEQLRRTAGSTGTPNLIRASREGQAAALAMRLVCQGWHGIGVGDREARFWGRAATGSHFKSDLRNALLNRTVFDTHAFEPDALDATLARLRRLRPDYAYGYASFFLRLSEELERRGTDLTDLGMKAAVLTAELSTPSERRRLAELLGCPVVDEYGCSEADILAYQCPAGGRHVAMPAVVLERLPVEGLEGVGELVLTDLHNLAMPLIRYRQGDLGRFAAETCACGRTWPVLESLEGRSRKQYMTALDGRSVHISPVVFWLEGEREKGLPVRRFRLEQRAADLLVLHLVLAHDDPDGMAALQRGGEALLRDLLGGDVRLELRQRDDIPLEPGRKFTFFTNLLEEDAGVR